MGEALTTHVWELVTKAYGTHLHESGRAASTVKARVDDIDRYQRHFERPLSATTSDLRSYLELQHRDHSAEYRKKLRASFRSFYGWAHIAGLIDRDPSSQLPMVRVPRPYPHPVPSESLAAALRVVRDEHVRAVLLLGGALGLRRTEIANLHPHDRHDDWLQVMGKGSKPRHVPLDYATRQCLCRLEETQGLDSYYFPGRFGGSVHPTTVYKWARASLAGEWSLHSLRHRAATAGYAGTKDLRATQEFLGHSSPVTTQIYVGVSQRALEAVVAASVQDLY